MGIPDDQDVGWDLVEDYRDTAVAVGLEFYSVHRQRTHNQLVALRKAHLGRTRDAQHPIVLDLELRILENRYLSMLDGVEARLYAHRRDFSDNLREEDPSLSVLPDAALGAVLGFSEIMRRRVINGRRRRAVLADGNVIGQVQTMGQIANNGLSLGSHRLGTNFLEVCQLWDEISSRTLASMDEVWKDVDLSVSGLSDEIKKMAEPFLIEGSSQPTPKQQVYQAVLEDSVTELQQALSGRKYSAETEDFASKVAVDVEVSLARTETYLGRVRESKLFADEGSLYSDDGKTRLKSMRSATQALHADSARDVNRTLRAARQYNFSLRHSLEQVTSGLDRITPVLQGESNRRLRFRQGGVIPRWLNRLFVTAEVFYLVDFLARIVGKGASAQFRSTSPWFQNLYTTMTEYSRKYEGTLSSALRPQFLFWDGYVQSFLNLRERQKWRQRRDQLERLNQDLQTIADQIDDYRQTQGDKPGLSADLFDEEDDDSVDSVIEIPADTDLLKPMLGSAWARELADRFYEGISDEQRQAIGVIQMANPFAISELFKPRKTFSPYEAEDSGR